MPGVQLKFSASLTELLICLQLIYKLSNVDQSHLLLILSLAPF